MGPLWILKELVIAPQRFPKGFLVDALLILYGCTMGFLWIPCIFLIGSLWILCGFLLGSLWNPCDFQWIP